LKPFTKGHCVFVHKGSTVGENGIKLYVTDVVTVPSVISEPGFVNCTVIYNGSFTTGFAGESPRFVI
jgi:hypothetical protein